MAEVEAGTDTTAVVSKPVVESNTSKEVVVEINGDHKRENADTKGKEVTTQNEETKEEKENGETAREEAPKETETAAATAEVVEAEEEVPPKVILHQFPPAKNIPSLSLFCLKIETFLRLNKIPYENQYGFKMGKKGKLPWVEYKGERKSDSNFIMEFLNEKFETKMDEEFTDDQRALGRAVQVMLEENTYWIICYNRFIDNFNEYKKFIAPPSGGIGFSVSVKMAQRKVRSYLDAQGLGRHSREEVYQIAEKDIKAVSDLLGDKDFILGDKPSSYDCTVFGFFANILLLGGYESPLSTFVQENAKNLIDYCERMKVLCWIDWADVVLGDKPEPIKKGFSFRKKKPKVQKPKEEEAPAEGSGEAAAEETAPDAEESAPAETEASIETPKGGAVEVPEEKKESGDVKEDTPAKAE